MRQRGDKEDEVKEKHPPQLLGGERERGGMRGTHTKTEPHLLLLNMWPTAAKRGREKRGPETGGMEAAIQGLREIQGGEGEGGDKSSK